MEIRHFFSGNAIDAVDAEGGVALPDFVRRVIERRGDGRRIVFGPHETDRCLTGYDPGLAPALHDDLERRRLRDEAAGASAESHHARARRAFGLALDADYDESGRIVLPPFMRRRGRIEDLVLFVGAGASFEIWNPHLARQAGDEDLRELAAWRLEQAADAQQISREKEP